MAEKKSITIVRLLDNDAIELIKQTNIEYQYRSKSVSYQKTPWHLPHSITLDNFEKIPLSFLDGTYGVAYYFEDKGIMIEFNQQCALCTYFMDIQKTVIKSDYQYIEKWLHNSVVAIVGFEIIVRADSPDKSIEMILKDKSQYPLIVIRNNIQEKYYLHGEWCEKRMQILKELINPVEGGV